MTYLDHNATTPLKPQAAARMAHMAGLWGNASSVHRYGREVRQHMMAARHTLSGAVGATPAGIVFCSGATEALHLALAQCAPTQVAYTAIEHDAVRAAAGTQATVIPATPDGVVHLIALEKILQQGSIKLVACMLANNETGVLQPVADVAALAKKYGAMVVVDAVQAVGKIPFHFGSLGVDMAAISAHKMGGPAGMGALLVREGLDIRPILRGGGQEMNRRAGTENFLGIMGFAAAAETLEADLAFQQNLSAWKNAFEEKIVAHAPHATIAGRRAPRLPNTTCVIMKNTPSETQVVTMDLEGIAISAGAACSSGRVKPSHVLQAMGFDAADAASAIRISSGRTTTEADYVQAWQVWLSLYQRKHSTPSTTPLAA